MTTPTTDAIKLAIEALQSSQDYVDAAANAQYMAGWGEQMDKAAAAIKALAALQEQARDGEADCRIELVNAVHTLASHYENNLYKLNGDEEALRLAKGDIAHAMKIAAKWNWNGSAPQPAQPSEHAQPVALPLPLTYKQINDVCVDVHLKRDYNTNLEKFIAIARAIEAAHGIGGGR